MRDTRRILLLALGSLILLRAGLAFSAAEQIGTFSYDGAHHATVARAIASGSPGDPVLWHYLAPPTSVVRPPGDYWPAGWPWLLAQGMRGVGTSQSAVVLLCALLSLLLPLAVYWLSRELGLPRREAWLAGALVALLGPLQVTGVTPDVTLPYQLLSLATLALAVRAWRRARPTAPALLLVGLLAGCACALRGDGIVLLLTALAMAGFPREGAGRARRLALTALGGALGLAPLLAYDLATFGAYAPAARRLVPWLTDVRELYVYGSDPTPAAWLAAGPVTQIFGAAAEGAWGFVAYLPWALVLLALVEASRVRDGARGSHSWPLTGWVALSLLVPATASAAVFNPARLAHNTAPVLCVLAAWSLGDLRRLRHLHRALPGAACALALLAATSWAFPLQFALPWDTRWLGDKLGPPAFLQPAGRPHLEPSDVVLTTHPWQAGWELGVRCVQLPLDGAAATEAVIDRYGVTLMILTPDRASHYLPQLARSWQVLSVTRQGTWIALGPPRARRGR